MKGFEFDPITHVGRMHGEIWPSATQLLKEFKLVDYSTVPADVLESKRVLGTRVHVATDLLDKHVLDEEHFQQRFPECVPYLEAYRKFRTMTDYEPSNERAGRLVSLKWKFHGEPDEHGVHLATRNGDAYLIDYKCTFAMYPSTGAQLAGYKILIEECLKIKIKKRLGLLLKPNGSFDLYPFDDANDRQDFLACLWLWHQRVNKYKTLKPDRVND